MGKVFPCCFLPLKLPRSALKKPYEFSHVCRGETAAFFLVLRDKDFPTFPIVLDVPFLLELDIKISSVTLRHWESLGFGLTPSYARIPGALGGSALSSIQPQKTPLHFRAFCFLRPHLRTTVGKASNCLWCML